MTAGRNAVRSLAHTVARWASLIMPRPRQHWMLAASNELPAIADDRAALRWALGGLRTACVARWRSLRLLDRGGVRWSAATLALVCASTAMLPTLMTLAFRLRDTRLLDALGQLTPGNDWQRFMPLMERLPESVHAGLLAAGLCYLAGAVGMLRRRDAAAIGVLAGLALDLSSRALGHLFIDPADVVVRNPSLLSQIIFPVVLPSLLSLVAAAGGTEAAG